MIHSLLNPVFLAYQSSIWLGFVPGVVAKDVVYDSLKELKNIKELDLSLNPLILLSH